MIIYKTTNLINGKFYIGQDSNNNPDYYGSGLILNRAIDKYGKDKFKKETLEVCTSKKELNLREIFWINKLNCEYNIAVGGSGGDTYSNNPNLSAIIDKLSGTNNHFYNKKHSDETRVKMSESQIKRFENEDVWNKGKSGIYSKEHIENLSTIRKEKYSGENHPRYVDIDKDELDLILKTNTIKMTANHFNVSVSCLREKINKYNLVIKRKSGIFAKPLPSKVVNKILSLRKNGKTIVEIASIVGVGINKTKRVLVTNGVNIKRIR